MACRGIDGQAYVPQIMAEPARPLAHQRLHLRAAFVDAETEEPSPDDIAIADGLPAVVPATFYLRIDCGAITGQFEQVGHGIYEGKVQFWGAGTWSIEVSVTQADGSVVPVMVSAIEVGRE